MSNNLRSLFLILITSIIFTGCYTVAWQPGEALPSKDNLEQTQSSFYNVKDFGVFSDYYNSAWWVNPDNDFLRNNLTAKNDFNNDNENLISDDRPVPIQFIPILIGNLPVGPPVVVITKPIKLIKSTTVKDSKPTRKVRSNKNKIRNNNGGRKSSRGRRR